MLARLASPALGAVRVDGAHLHRDDGRVASVVESGDVDVPALDAARRGLAVAAFARLCRTLETPLQIVVQVRRWHDGEQAAETHHEATSLTASLRQASAAHRRHTLQRRPAFRRSILFVPSAPAAADLDAATRQCTDALRTAGVGATVLRDDALRHRIAEAMGSARGEPHTSATATGTATTTSATATTAAATTATTSATTTTTTAATTVTVAPPPWQRQPTHATLGDLHVRAIVLRRLPGVAVDAGWLAALLDVRAECDVSLHVTPVGVADAMSAIGRRLRTLRADQLVELDRESYGDAHVEAGVGSALDLRGRLARNEGRAARISLVAVARAPDLPTLDHATDALRTAAAATLAHCEPAHLQHLEAAASAWPVGRDLLDAAKLVDTTALATCIPWTSTTCDDAHGYALGHATTTHTPVRIAPFDTTHHSNANVAVIAASGQGKSYAIGTLVLEAAARGAGSVIIDPEGEYEHIVHSLGGDYVHLRPGCDTALNVFDVGDSTDSVAAVIELVAILCGGQLDEVERVHLDAAATEAITSAARQGRTPILGDCLPMLEAHAPRPALVLRRFCTGPLGDLFNRPTSARLDAPVVGVSLRDLSAELVPAATLVVAEWLWSLVRRDRRERHVVFDEVGLLCAHPPLRTLLVQLARRCRKYGASLVVATQNAGDLLSTPEGTVVATNPAIVLLGGHRGAETQRMEDAFALTAQQRSFLESAGRGDFLLLAGNRRLPVHVEVPPLHHALLTGRPVPAAG
jgi:Helicase HerA, central domain